MTFRNTGCETQNNPHSAWLTVPLFFQNEHVHTLARRELIRNFKSKRKLMAYLCSSQIRNGKTTEMCCWTRPGSHSVVWAKWWWTHIRCVSLPLRTPCRLEWNNNTKLVWSSLEKRIFQERYLFKKWSGSFGTRKRSEIGLYNILLLASTAVWMILNQYIGSRNVGGQVITEANRKIRSIQTPSSFKMTFQVQKVFNVICYSYQYQK